jgi:hypothetical protein
MLRNRVELDSLLKQELDEGAGWPIDRFALRAILQTGLTIEQIARFFSVDPQEVQALLDSNK